MKKSIGSKMKFTLFYLIQHIENIIHKKTDKKTKILCGVLIWVYKLAKKISSHFDIGGVYMLHRGTCAFSSNHDYTHRLSRFLWFIGVSMSYSSQTFSYACTGHVWRKHQVWDFPEMVCYFLRFNWISTRRHRLIICWTESTHEKIQHGAKLLHRL